MSPRELSKEIERLQKRVVEIEEDISRREDGLRKIEEVLSTPTPELDVLAESTRYAAEKEALDEVVQTWEDTQLQLEALIASRAS